MKKWKYITPEDYQEAQENGISRAYLWQRWDRGWSRERAVNESVRKHGTKKIGGPRKVPMKITKERKAMLDKIGVSEKMAQRRYLEYKWPIEDVLTTKPIERGFRKFPKNKNGRVEDEP